MAIEQARLAAEIGEVPVGAVIVRDGVVISKGYNRVEIDNDPTKHAEIIAIKKAAEILGSWRLLDCTIYITLEPCAMCAGAIIASRIKRVVIGTQDMKRGCAGTAINLLDFEPFNHKCELERDILKDECSKLLSDFFAKLREEKKSKNLPGS